MKKTGTPKQKKTSQESVGEGFLIVGIGASAGGVQAVEFINGKTIRMCGVMSDITERVNFQENLRRSEDRLQKAIEIETISIVFLNEQDKFTDCNDAFLKMSGYTREEIISGGIGWRDITPPEWMRRSRKAAAELKLKGRTAPYEKESEVLRHIALGYSNQEIADKTNVSVKTIEAQKSNAFKKLNMQSRKDIIRYAILQGWMQEN